VAPIVTDPEDIIWLDATGQADLIRRHVISTSELIATASSRIEDLNPSLNAVIHPQLDEAATVASKNPPEGPFAGVPILFKDFLCQEVGRPHHCGMRVLKDVGWEASADSWLTQRFRRAGFVCLGRTNTPELATTVTTEPLAYGATRNPWDTARTPGGSSGGSAAAVASGMVAVAHGSDMGGSIRVPASNCGLVGLKPTRARTTAGPEFGEFWGPLTHQHVLTRSVRDSAAVLDAIAGAATGDPYCAPTPRRPWTGEVERPVEPLHVGFRTALSDERAVHPEVLAAVETTARLLDGMGHHVEPMSFDAMDDPLANEAVPIVWPAVVARTVDFLGSHLGRVIHSDELEPMNALLLEMAEPITAVQYLRALDALYLWGRTLQRPWSEGLDIMLLPVTPEPSVALDVMGPNSKTPPELIDDLRRMTAFTVPFNVTGQPSVSLPLHWTADGLPVGVQMVAAYAREDLLFRLASELERAVPWNRRRPL
jgi:amidase